MKLPAALERQDAVQPLGCGGVVVSSAGKDAIGPGKARIEAIVVRYVAVDTAMVVVAGAVVDATHDQVRNGFYGSICALPNAG